MRVTILIHKILDCDRQMERETDIL